MTHLCLICLCVIGQRTLALSQDAFVLETIEPTGEIVIGGEHSGLEGKDPAPVK